MTGRGAHNGCTSSPWCTGVQLKIHPFQHVNQLCENVSLPGLRNLSFNQKTTADIADCAGTWNCVLLHRPGLAEYAIPAVPHAQDGISCANFKPKGRSVRDDLGTELSKVIEGVSLSPTVPAKDNFLDKNRKVLCSARQRTLWPCP